MTDWPKKGVLMDRNRIMKEQLNILMEHALAKGATDIYFTLQEDSLQVFLRAGSEYVPVVQNIFDQRLMEYLRYLSGMDLTRIWLPQSGQFDFQNGQRLLSCRFSWLSSPGVSSGVIRILRSAGILELEDLTQDDNAVEFLKKITRLDNGLIISAGPTGSGKSTTIHAMLRHLAREQNRKIVTLEDPVEMEEDHLLQLEVSEEKGLSYENGIASLLRHDPDCIFIGECRSAYTAKMCIRAALTGHLVFTTLHAGSVLQVIGRLEELGVSESDLSMVLKAVFAQRLVPHETGKGKECVYEMADQSRLKDLLHHRDYPEGSDGMEKALEQAAAKGWISSASKIHSGL